MYYETVNTARLRRLASAGPDGAEDYQEFGTELFSPELNTKLPYLLCEIVKEKNTGREKRVLLNLGWRWVEGWKDHIQTLPRMQLPKEGRKIEERGW